MDNMSGEWYGHENSKKYGSWMDQAAVVKIDWYDYKGIKHQGQLSNLEKLDLNTKVRGD